MAPPPASSSRPLAATPTRAEDEGYCIPLPPLSSSNPGDAEILRQLLPLLERYHSAGHTGVNAGFPLWDPWNIPGMPLDEEEANRREKYYVTDCSVLKSCSTNPATQTGFWKPRDLGWGIPAEGVDPSRFAGLKTTYDFYVGETIHQEGIKGTSWIMDVYFLIDQKTSYQIEDDLVMCHVFKGNSREYDPKPRCAAHHHESPKEKGSLNPYHFQEQSLINQCDPNQAEMHAQSNSALLERPAGFVATHINSNKHLSPPDHAPQLRCVSHHQIPKENGSLAAHHQGFQLPNHGCNQNTGEPNHQAIGQSNDCDFLPLSPFSSIIVDNLAKEITGVEISMEMNDHDMPNGVSSTVSPSPEHGPLGKRARTKSPVWKKFTKLFTKAQAALAVCKHCYKVMTGDSSQGTSHLRRHKCHCNH